MTTNKPVAYLRWARLDQRWKAYDSDGKVIVADLHRDVVIRVCVDLGYRVVEEKTD